MMLDLVDLLVSPEINRMTSFLVTRSKYPGFGYGSSRQIGFTKFNTRGIHQVWDEMEKKIDQNSQNMSKLSVSFIRPMLDSSESLSSSGSVKLSRQIESINSNTFTVKADVHATQDSDPLVDNMIISQPPVDSINNSYPSTSLSTQDILSHADDIVSDVAESVAVATDPEVSLLDDLSNLAAKVSPTLSKISSSPAAFVGASKLADLVSKPSIEPMSNLESKLAANQNYRVSNIVSGVASGAVLGSEFGPIGTAVGAIAGGLLGDSGPVKIGTDVGVSNLNSTNDIF
ncbi:MAG: hypothetical protein FPoV1_gp2 [Fushun polycipivirus 1]|nr:MAG: hypothetical protein FPoV1_gp2 [Fushun polycipivirus 1]